MAARWIAALFSAAVLVTGCATTRGAATPEQRRRDLSVYLPLAVGNTWTYDRAFLGEKGEERVEIVKQADGYFVDGRGNALTVDAYGIRDPRRYLLRYPVEAGNSWTTVVSPSSMERYRILDVGFTCEVPAGRFEDCVRVEARNRIDREKTMINEITFAPHVGMVRFDFFLDASGRRIPQGQMLLKSYALKPAAPSAPAAAPAGRADGCGRSGSRSSGSATSGWGRSGSSRSTRR
ncbi:MAG: hypothetical protein IRZ16_01015 [Myxococcaceae bacterium]|nr:hypothetical protein [Myxococcaceae bacterium]